MEVAEDGAWAQRLNATRLHLGDYIVDIRRLRAEGPANRERTRDVRSVAFPLTTSIKANEFSAGEVLVVSLVMQSACILSRSDDGGVGLLLGVLRDAGFEKDGLEVGLVGCGVQVGEDMAVGGGGDVVGTADEGYLVLGFEDAGFVHGGLEGGLVDVGGWGCEAGEPVGGMQDEDLLVGVSTDPFGDVVGGFARVAHMVYLVLVQAFLDAGRRAHPNDPGRFGFGDIEG